MVHQNDTIADSMKGNVVMVWFHRDKVIIESSPPLPLPIHNEFLFNKIQRHGSGKKILKTEYVIN